MMKWMEFRSTDEYVRHQKSARSLNVTIDEEDDTVIFRAPASATFRTEEAVELLKSLLKQLEEE